MHTRRSFATLPSLGVVIIAGVVLTLFQPTQASVTVYYQQGQTPLSGPGVTPSSTASGATYTGLAAYNPVVLQAPPPPGTSALPNAFTIPLANAVPQGASIPVPGDFFGFSVEMSVVNQVLGKNASIIQVPFLNLMANLQQRVGQVRVRVGGNTQETAVLVPSTPDGRILEKDTNHTSNPTQTPPLIYTPELLYMLSNISSLVNVKWYLGIPFFNTTPFNLDIAEAGEAILGTNLLGLQAANEPDLYANHGHRPSTYSPQDYFTEFGQLIQQMNANNSIPQQNTLIAPSVSSFWTPEQIWDTGFLDSYDNSLGFLSVEHYPADNCAAIFPTPGNPPVVPQDIFPNYLSHQSALDNTQAYRNSSAIAAQRQKPLLMFETNTASCGGFPGVSDSFGAALWGADYALQLASAGFHGALYHVGGQGVVYNPFLPPPTNQSTFHQWTVGPIYYSALVVAEALGPTNTSQILDLGANNNNVLSPAYGIWENNQLARVVLFNFASDASGGSNLNVTISTSDGSPIPSSVHVKYLLAGSVSQKYNYTWAGQTYGGVMESDGRPIGQEDVKTVSCQADPTQPNAGCTIPVPAPAIALVFWSVGTGNLNEEPGQQSTTFATTAVTRAHNTVTVDPAVLQTSNGHGAFDKLGSTSPGSIGSGALGRRVDGMGLVGGVVAVGLAMVVGCCTVLGL